MPSKVDFDAAMRDPSKFVQRELPEE